jgi:hypothetical protein
MMEGNTTVMRDPNTSDESRTAQWISPSFSDDGLVTTLATGRVS